MNMAKQGTVFDELLRALKREGVDLVFGVVGRESQFISFPPAGPRFVLVRNEQNSGIMAEVYARITGRAQACFSTLGPGVTNMTTGVASAFKERSPLLALSAQIERGDRVPAAHQYLDSAAIMKPVTLLSREPATAEELSATLGECFAAMRGPRPGPCFLSLPIDLLREPAPAALAAGSRLSVKPDTEARSRLKSKAEALAAKIREAEQPLLICGQSALPGKVPALVRALAEKARIPVATSMAGKGVIPESHPLALGALSKYVEPFFEYSLERDLFSGVDLVILCGYDYAEDLSPELWGETEVCRIDSFPNDVPDRVRATLDLHEAPLAETLAMLIEGQPEGRKSVRVDVEKLRKARDRRAASAPAGGALCPFRVSRLLQDELGAGDTVVVDVGLHKHILGLTYEAERPLGYIGSNSLATMGFGLPAGIGAKLAEPDRNVVVVCGDGGLGAVIGELETCVRERIALTLVVFKNSAFGLIDRYHRKGFGEPEPRTVSFGEVDFAGLARGWGAHGVAVKSEDELRQALRDSVGGARVTLIEVPVDYAPVLKV